VFVGCTN